MKWYYLKIEYKRGDIYLPEVVENFRYRFKISRWWKMYIDTVALDVKTSKNGFFEKYSLYPYFTKSELEC